MKKINKCSILTLAIIVCGVFFVINKAWAMPIGTLLYRTSSGEKMYGYNTNELFKMDGLNPKINCGHVGIYAGEIDGEYMILETVSNGVQLIPAKYFVNLGKKEKFIGAKIPKNLNDDKRKDLKKIINFLGTQGLAYDFDLKYHKGPESGQWTCVGLAEKIYESLDFGREFVNLNQLEYAPQKYEIDITPDGYDNTSFYNIKKNDYFSSNLEFSKIGRREKFLEIVGYNFGKVVGEDRYFFFPYTQFLQEGLKDIKVDIPLESAFIEGKIRGTPPKGKIIAKAFINNTKSSIKITGDRAKKLAIEIKDIFTGEGQKSTKLAEDFGDVLPAKEKQKKNFPEVTLKDLAPDPVITSPDKKKEEKPAQDQLGISYVIDGDTFVLTTGEKVRYIGIDSPELGEDGEEDDECLAWVARLMNMELLGRGELKLIKDESADKDKYGRLLRYVYINDIFVNEKLVREGLAKTFFCEEGWENCPIAKDMERQKIIVEAGGLAQQEKIGIFSNICQEEIMVDKKEELPPDQPEDKKIVKEEENEEEIIQPEGNVSKLPLFHTGGGENKDKAAKEENDQNKEDDEEEEPPPSPIINMVISEFITRGQDGKATNEFLELYNPNDKSINLLGWRLQYKSATGESWRNKTGKKGLPEIIIPANGYLLLASKDYDGSITPDYKHSATWGLADKGGHIRIVDNFDRKIDKVGYRNAIDPEGEAIEVDLSDGTSLERKALATSTSQTMATSGSHWVLGNAYDSDNNKNDFVAKQNPEPQNASSPSEPKEIPLAILEAINDLSIISSSIATNSIMLTWSAPRLANLEDDSFYDLRYITKEGDCNLEQNWEEAISAPILPTPATTTEEKQTALVINLLPNTEYCFAIKTYNNQNWSQISNQVSEKTEERLHHIEIGNSSFSGGWTHAFSWDHTIEEGQDRVLIVSVYMYFKKNMGKITFADLDMTKATEVTQRGDGINSIIYYLKDPPVGTHKIALELENDSGTTMVASALNLYNCDLENLIVASSVKKLNQKNFFTDIKSPFNNTMAVEATTLNGRSGNFIKLSPLSGQTEFFNHCVTHVYFGYTVAMSYKELERGINRLEWKKGNKNNVTQNIIVLKPKSID